MLNNLLSLFAAPKRTLCRPKSDAPRYRPADVGEEHFNMLVSLQMAVRDETTDCEKNTAAEMLHGANNANLRKQGRLCLTFALKNYCETYPPERVKIANELEECIDAAYAGEQDYRQRIYIVGGYLNENPSLLRRLLSGEATAEDIALASPNYNTLGPYTNPRKNNLTGDGMVLKDSLEEIF